MHGECAGADANTFESLNLEVFCFKCLKIKRCNNQKVLRFHISSLLKYFKIENKNEE